MRVGAQCGALGRRADKAELRCLGTRGAFTAKLEVAWWRHALGRSGDYNSPRNYSRGSASAGRRMRTRKVTFGNGPLIDRYALGRAAW